MQSKCMIEEFNMLSRSYEPDIQQLLQLAALQLEDGSFPNSYRLGDYEIFPLWFIAVEFTEDATDGGS